MKVLVCSDSHGDTRLLEDAISREAPDLLLHLGDVVADVEKIALRHPALPLVAVCGNCDFGCDLPAERLLSPEGHCILMTHGHRYGVKSGCGAAVTAALAQGAEILLFGHTHTPLCDRAGALWILNPGSIRGGAAPTYGIVTLDKEHIACRVVSAAAKEERHATHD